MLPPVPNALIIPDKPKRDDNDVDLPSMKFEKLMFEPFSLEIFVLLEINT